MTVRDVKVILGKKGLRTITNVPKRMATCSERMSLWSVAQLSVSLKSKPTKLRNLLMSVIGSLLLHKLLVRVSTTEGPQKLNRVLNKVSVLRYKAGLNVLDLKRIPLRVSQHLTTALPPQEHLCDTIGVMLHTHTVVLSHLLCKLVLVGTSIFFFLHSYIYVIEHTCVLSVLRTAQQLLYCSFY